jgi:hypothetical protein
MSVRREAIIFVKAESLATGAPTIGSGIDDFSYARKLIEKWRNFVGTINQKIAAAIGLIVMADRNWRNAVPRSGLQ